MLLNRLFEEFLVPRSSLFLAIRCVLAAAVLGWGFARVGLAQPVSPADLRREIESLQAENQRLVTRIADLERQLAASSERAASAEARVSALNAEIGRLRDALSRGGGDVPPVQAAPVEPGSDSAAGPAVAPIPEEPLASPASLIAALQRRYADSFPQAEGESSPPPFDAARKREFEQWCATQARGLHGPISWRVRLTNLSELSRGTYSVVLAVLDPATDLVIGTPIEVALPRTYAERVRREIARAGGDAKAPAWVLTGELSAQPKVNATRGVPGVFNHPAFIGPYVEFDFGLKWADLTLAPASASANPAAVPTP